KEDADGLESLRMMSKHLESLIDKGEKSLIGLQRDEERTVPKLKNSIVNSKIQRIAFNIEGTVVDQEGVPLIGVNIQVKGTNMGTSTDFEGHFTLEDINENAILVISYIG